MFNSQDTAKFVTIVILIVYIVGILSGIGLYKFIVPTS